jgi:hypothetical protein
MRERRIWTRKAVKMMVLRAKMEVFVIESMVAGLFCRVLGLGKYGVCWAMCVCFLRPRAYGEIE